MTIDPKDIHIVLIGYDKQFNYTINLEIFRYNYSFGNDLWITNVYNGDHNRMTSGIGENTFLRVDENRGYHRGVLDLYNKGLSFARLLNRKYTLIMNYDVWILNEDCFLKLFQDLEDSGKAFSTGIHNSHLFPMSDLCIFKTNFIPQEFIEGVIPSRYELDVLKEHYGNTENGWNTFEEWFYYGLDYRCSILNTGKKTVEENWHVMDRQEFPRYRWTPSNTILHEHDLQVKQDKLNEFGIRNGSYVNHFLSGKIESR